ncbi:MAG: hypothetical protein WDM96_03340 [Lacunisphaera sp.]
MTLDVLETITGTPPQPLVLDLVGGRVGKEELTIEGAPKFSPGQESILFVRGNGQVYFPLVGLTHGYFPVRRDRAPAAPRCSGPTAARSTAKRNSSPTPSRPRRSTARRSGS